MIGPASSGQSKEASIDALTQRAERIVKARPAYREMVGFYVDVFRRQIEWRDRLVVHPEPVGRDEVRACLSDGTPLVQRYDAGIEPDSLAALWAEMKTVFHNGNPVLKNAIATIDEAEQRSDLLPASWLGEQRPDRAGLVREAADRIGVEEPVLATLTRAVTFPHWQVVAQAWLPSSGVLAEWKRFRCPTCGGPPALVELAAERSGDANIQGATRRFMHCAFCASRWLVPDMKCPACGSTVKGDAKYFFTSDEPDLRIDFCKRCNHYVKVVDAGQGVGCFHVGLESLTTAHLDVIAGEKNLKPLEVPA